MAELKPCFLGIDPGAEDGDSTGYWCVVCKRLLLADDMGVIVHDAVPHPESMTFDEEDNPQ